MFSTLCFTPHTPQKHSVVGKAYFLSNFFSVRDHALLHKGLFFERPMRKFMCSQWILITILNELEKKFS